MALDLQGKFRGDNEPEVVKAVRRKIMGGKKGFSFDENTHKYLLDGVELLSTTTWMKRFQKKFEKLYISNMTANSNKKKGRKYLTDDKTVRKYWNAIGSRASALGTSGHAFCEAYWLDPENTKPLHKVEENALKVMQNLMERYEIVNMEESRGNKRYMIGYTIDLELIDKKTGKMVLGDFKFSKAFTSEQYKQIKNRQPNLMLDPFRSMKMRDITKDKGEIQLNVYKHLYQLDTGLEVDYCILIHIDGTNSFDWYGDKGYKVYKCRDLQGVIQEQLKPQSSVEYQEVDKNFKSLVR